jgi:AbrB family looped-hinge helix DNA binding protein
VANRISQKGQVVIPAPIRRKHHLEPGAPVSVVEEGGRIIITPLPKDPVSALFGLLKDAGALTDDLIADRRREERNEAKRSR